MGGDLKTRIKAKLFRRNSATPSFLSSNGSSSLKQDGASSTHSHTTRARSPINGDVPSTPNSIAGEEEHENHLYEPEDGHEQHEQNPPDSSPSNASAKKSSSTSNNSMPRRPTVHFQSMTSKSSDGSERPSLPRRSWSLVGETTITISSLSGTGSGVAQTVGGGTSPATTSRKPTAAVPNPPMSPGTANSLNNAVNSSDNLNACSNAAGFDGAHPPTATGKAAALTNIDNSNNANTDAHNTLTAASTLSPSPLPSTTAKLSRDLHTHTLTAPRPTSPATITTSQANKPLESIREYRPATSGSSRPTSRAATTHLSTAGPQTGGLKPAGSKLGYDADVDDDNDDVNTDQEPYPPATRTPSSPAVKPPISPRPPGPPRRQSILPNRQTKLITALLDTNNDSEVGSTDSDQLVPISGTMVTRKIWVKRPLASATMITINEDDLVDDVRDLILRKYANSLGRQYDAPDLTLRICPRDREPSRVLQPDEPMGRTLDAHYPGGQTVDEALLIDIPSRRTPKASPNPRYYGDDRPQESGTDYFPPYPPNYSHPHHTPTATINGTHTIHLPPSMAVISGGQFPALPSPGSVRRMGGQRPKVQRMHTASPASTATNGGHPPQSGASSDHSNASHPAPAPPPMPSPPAPERVATPPPRVSSPRPTNRPKKAKQKVTEGGQQQQQKPQTPSLPSGLLNGAVPPINVLIVEDNPINLRLLEAFVKRLKVRWQTAVNGLEAVSKWRAGGFHLVLMDIQLPKMNGLEATREIRRIEKVNNIGVYSSSASSALSPREKEKAPEPEKEEDRLVNTEMFKSPVIIVALTASSLQSDRHEALAAGCNDFLTKPVNFVWLERKVKEWGCMQALIDFDGWRKWKDFSQKSEEDEAGKKATSAASKAKATKKNRLSIAAGA
ncbi:hypothetical protein DL766_007744 [Monosporascus sp. MC13-8B]|uniref:Response regulatory domain-containing protein n=1 Tax=Monosporascus cannonballus TaxID=155416 RepID=A0ABY0HBU5_9PEZI|nr:hypothetical protein DL762_003171 [Monosporascus cannonballus]RYO90642.1 hypothetical protein DL763_005260 [Monosporascus cannonballus]RYP22322.1 hypothetical protein DL766_007744 [Monosporascus sp. MC13-8B]